MMRHSRGKSFSSNCRRPSALLPNLLGHGCSQVRPKNFVPVHSHLYPPYLSCTHTPLFLQGCFKQASALPSASSRWLSQSDRELKGNCRLHPIPHKQLSWPMPLATILHPSDLADSWQQSLKSLMMVRRKRTVKILCISCTMLLV